GRAVRRGGGDADQAGRGDGGLNSLAAWRSFPREREPMITGLAIFAPIAVMGPGLRGDDRPSHSTFTPAAWITGAQRSRSRARNAAKTSGGPIRGSTPSLVKAVSISGEARASLIAALSLAMMAGV